MPGVMGSFFCIASINDILIQFEENNILGSKTSEKTEVREKRRQNWGEMLCTVVKERN
jgi:hypothetical protein